MNKIIFLCVLFAKIGNNNKKQKGQYNMENIKGTKTESNILHAFAAEAQAKIKYDFYAQKAKSDGFVQIEKVFDEISHNELEHAKIWFKYLNGGEVPTTDINLADAASGEKYEWSEMYSQFAQEAREEGFEDIASKFDMIASIEKDHESRYESLRSDIDKDSVFSKGQQTRWICQNCGYIFEGEQAPEVCPVCAQPQSYYKVYGS